MINPSDRPNDRGEIILILGGARSGKSTFAEEFAKRRAGNAVLFIATAEPLDDEMRERIEQHRASRPPHWKTLEAPRNLLDSIAKLPEIKGLMLLDCLTLWVTNEMLADENDLERRLLCQLDLLIGWARVQSVDLVMVSNEVGLGIVPENALARRFRDVLGKVNAHVAQSADKVYWMVAGLAVEVKSLAARGKD